MKQLAVAVALAACGSSNKPPAPPPANLAPPGPAPVAVQPLDCEKLLAKVVPVFMPGKTLTPQEHDQAIKECREQIAKNPDDPLLRCVDAAPDATAIKVCMEKQGAAEDDHHKPKRIEAAIQLNKLGKNAKVVYLTNSEFTKGKAAKLPAKSCCGQPQNHCEVTDDWTKDPVWQALDFQLDEPSLFQYTYESDGKTFHAEAIGDLDCDGIFITYKLDGTSDGGNPSVKLTAPPPNAD